MPSIILTDDSKYRIANNLQAAVRYYNQIHPRGQVDGSEFGVDKSTIRAFHGFNKPLATFNAWAEDSIPQLARASEVEDQQEFDTWYERLVITLDTAFGQQALAPYQRHKLADLYLKWASRFNEILTAARKRIVNFGHCPLDSYSLGLLREVAPGTVLNSAAPSMSVITSEAAYQYVQEIVREICEQIPCRPLDFDYVAWNAAH